MSILRKHEQQQPTALDREPTPEALQELETQFTEQGWPYMGRHFYELVAKGEFIPGMDLCVPPAMTMDTINYLEVEEGQCVEDALKRHFNLPLAGEEA